MLTGTLKNIFKESDEIEDYVMTIENTFPDAILQRSYLSSTLKTSDQTKEQKILELYFSNKTKPNKISRLLNVSRQRVYQTIESVKKFCIKGKENKNSNIRKQEKFSQEMKDNIKEY